MGKTHRARKPGGSSIGGSGTMSNTAASKGISSNKRTSAAASGKNGSERITRSSRAKLTNGLEDPAQVEKELNAQLRSMGLYAANTMGDGNCLFRALSDQLYGYPHQHSILREQVCDYLATKADKYAAFIDVENSFEEYVGTMRQSGTYGGHLELSAFAQFQQKEIKIVQPGLVYIVSGDDESPKATKEREKREKERQLAQSKTVPGSEGPPPSERELRRLRREKRTKGLEEDPFQQKVGESSKMALKNEISATEEIQSQEELKERSTAEAYGPLYIAYHNWEHYSSIRNIEGPHTGLPRIREINSSIITKANGTAVVEEEEKSKCVVPTEEEALVLRSVKGYSLEQVRFYIKRHGGWEEALEAILAQNAVDDDETEEEDSLSTAGDGTVVSSPDDAARADEAAGPSLSMTLAGITGQLYSHNAPLLDHLRDWRAGSPSSVDTIGTHSSLEGGSASTHATTDEAPESASLHSNSRKSAEVRKSKESKRNASKDHAPSLRSPKRRSRSRSPMQIKPDSKAEHSIWVAKDIDGMQIRASILASEVEAAPIREPSKLRVCSTKPLSMRERRQARQAEKERRAAEAKSKRQLQATQDNKMAASQTSAPHVRGFLELKI